MLSPATVRETCTDITSAHNLFNQAGANYRYYSEGEEKKIGKRHASSEGEWVRGLVIG